MSCSALGLSSPAAACGADAEKGCRWSRCPQPKSKWLIGDLPFCPPHRPQPARCARCPRMCSAGVWLQPSSTMPPSLRLSPAAKMAPTTPFAPPQSAQTVHAPPAAIGAPTRALPWKPACMQVPCRVLWPMQVLTLKHPMPHSSAAAHCCAPVMGQPHRFWGGRGHILTRACLYCLSSIAVHVCSS